MAQRKKRPVVRKRKSITRREARKPSKSALKRPAKLTVARATPRKRPANAKLKGEAKKARKRVKVVKPPITPAVEIATEIEPTEVHEVSGAPEEPEDIEGSPVTDQEISILCDILERSDANFSADKRRLLDQLIVKGFVEPANQEGPAKYKLT